MAPFIMLTNKDEEQVKKIRQRASEQARATGDTSSNAIKNRIDTVKQQKKSQIYANLGEKILTPEGAREKYGLPIATHYYSKPNFTVAENQLQREVSEAERKLQLAVPDYEKLVGNVSASAEQLQRIKQQYLKNPTAENKIAYEQSQQHYKNSMAPYLKEEKQHKPLFDAYRQAMQKQERYTQQYEEDYNKWKSTIRPENQITAELNLVNQEISELEKEKEGLNTGWGLEVAENGIEGLEQLTDTLSSNLENLYKRKDLLQEELHYAEYFRYADLRENEDFTKLSQVNEAFRNDPQYRYINNLDHTRDSYQGASNIHPGVSNPFAQYDYLYGNESTMYNYLYNKEGKESAEEYLDYIGENLNYRRGQELAQGYRDGEGLERTLGRVGQGVDAVGAGVESFFTGMAQNFVKEDLPTSALQYAFQLGREEAKPVGRFVLDSLYTGGNMAPSILLSSVTAGLGGTIGVSAGLASRVGSVAGSMTMGLSAAGNAYNEKIKAGYDSQEARTYSVLIGLSESLLQYALGGISKLGGKVTGNLGAKINAVDSAFWRVSGKLGLSMHQEGMEEGLQTVLEPLFTTLIFDEEYTPAEWEDIAYSYLLGAVMGGIFEGGEIAGSERYNARLGNSIQSNPEGVETLLGKGLDLAPDSPAYQGAQKLLNRLNQGKKLSNYQPGRLASSNSSLSGASPNATMTAKGGMQNGQAESGRGRAVPRNGQSDDGGLGAGTDAGNPGVGNLGGSGIPGWQPLRGQRETSAGVLESSTGNQREPDRQGSAARGGNLGLVPGSRIPEITKRLKEAGTAVVDDNGTPILLTHWTPNMDFTEFGEGDVGFHFGSRAQAEERARKQGSNENAGRYIQAYLNIKNPVHMPTDQYGWNAAQAAITLWNQDILPFEEYKRIERMAVEDRGRYNAESSKALRDLLESYGYDGIVYENEFEGAGKSYVAFHPEQVIWIDDGTGRGGDTDRLRPMSGQDSVASVPQDTDSSAGNIRGQDVFPIPEGEGAEQQRGLAGNTIPQGVEAGTIPEEAAQGIAKSKRAQYRPVSMDQSQKAVAAGIDAIGGARNAYGELLSTLGKRPLNSTEMAAATQLVQRNDLTVDEKTILLTQVMESATDMGRAINMIKAFSRNTPEGLLYTAQRQIDRWNADMAQGKAPIELSAEEKADLLSLGELISRWDEAGMTVQTRRELLNRVERSMRDKTKKNVEDIVKRAHPGEETDWFTYLSQGIVANKIPSTLADKFRSMQRINLLLQIKTQIRNVGGNFLHSIAETTSDIVATPFDKVLSKVTGVRTVGLPSFRTYANGFSRGLRDVNLARKTGLTNVRGIRQTDGKAVPPTVFQGENKAAQLANHLDNTTSFLLSLGDEGFRRGRENMTRERLRELNPKNNDWVEELAARVGDAATFQEDTALSGALMRIRSAPGQAIRNNGRKNGNGNQTPAEAADILAYAAVPFAKTPANMLVQTARYSPVGLLNGIRQVVKIAVDAKRGKTITPQQQRQAVDALGRGIIGSGLTGIGYFLRSFGVATGEENEDPDKAPLDRGFGLLPNSMKIGNYTIDFSSMAPIPVAINLGASIYNELHKEGLDDPTALGIIETVLSAPINDLTEDSLWQGLTSFVSTASSQGLPAALRDVTLDGISQAIPFNSFLRAVTGVIDPYVRETSAETAIGQWWNQTKAQLPGLSLTLPVRYDSMGNPMTRTPADGVAGRIFHSIINPVTVARDTTDDPVYQMLSELHEQTGRTDIFPQVSPYGLTYGGQKYDIAGADRSRFQQTQGQTAAEMLYDLANAPSFQQMDANEQAEVVADALGYGRDLAKIEYLDNLKIPYEGESLSRKINKLTDQGVSPSAVLVVGAADNTNTIVNGESQKNSGGAKVAKTISQLNITDRQKMALASEFCGKEIQAAMQVALDTGANQPAMMDLLVSISNADTDETPYPATAKAQLVYHAAGLTMEQKKAFSDEFIKDGVDYTSEESAIITSLSASAQSKWVKAKEWGFTPLQYSEYVKAANTSGKKVDKLQALQELFEAEYGSEINSAQWAEQFYALMHTKRYD